MLKLTVVSGPNRGATFPLASGETSIGRQMGNVIVLPSNRVSKKHCALEVEGDRIQIKDLGSANGTFVNGVLTKGKELRAGDRISVGEFVFELVRPGAKPARPVQPGMGGGSGLIQNNVVPFPGMAGLPAHSGQGFGLSGLPQGGHTPAQALPVAPPVPQNLGEKIKFFVEERFLPAMFGMLQKNEWRMIGQLLLVVFVLVSVMFVVQPLVDRSDFLIRNELMKRTRYMAKLIVNQNTQHIVKGEKNRVDLAGVENEEGIKYAVVIDMEGTLIAPLSRANQPFNAGEESVFALSQIRKYKRKDKSDDHVGASRNLEGQVVVSVEPFKVFNPRTSTNEIVALALVSADASLAVPAFAQSSISYLETMLYLLGLGAILGFIFYRVTLRPFQVLNDDIDRVLRGELPEVTHEYKFSEMDSLWEVINQALQQIPKRGSGDVAAPSLLSNPSDAYLGPIRTLLPVAQFGMVLLDESRRIVTMNPIFEELSGIRLQGVEGQELASQGRDQSFGEFVNDVCNRAPVGAEGLTESYDFSGIPHKVHVAAFGPPGGGAKGFLFCAVKAEG
jgi:hypothetical protein